MASDCVLPIKALIMNRLQYRFDVGPGQFTTHMLKLPTSTQALGPGSPVVVDYLSAMYILRSSDYGSRIVFSGAIGMNNSPALAPNKRDSFFYGSPETAPTYDPELLECNYCCANGLSSGHRILPV